METVGFVGLGKMGTPMAVNIQKAGYPMVVYDISEGAVRPLLEGGARLAGSPAEAARLSEVLFSSLPRPQVVEQVVKGPEGILEGIQPGGIYLDMSTCGPDLIRRLEPLFRDKGAHVMDSPVLSSPQDAIDRGVILMVGRGTGPLRPVAPDVRRLRGQGDLHRGSGHRLHLQGGPQHDHGHGASSRR